MTTTTQTALNFNPAPAVSKNEISSQGIRSETSLAEAIKAWLEKEWPKQKFGINVAKTGQAVWEAVVIDGAGFTVWCKRSGYSDQHLGLSLGGTGYFHEGGKLNEREQWLAAMLSKFTQEVKARQPKFHPNWTIDNISPAAAAQLAAGYERLQQALKRIMGHGLHHSSDKATLDDSLTGNFTRTLNYCPRSRESTHYYDPLITIESHFQNQRHTLRNYLTTNMLNPPNPYHERGRLYVAKNPEELTQLMEELAHNIPHLIATLPSPRRELLQGKLRGDDHFHVVPNSAKASYCSDACTNSEVQFQIEMKGSAQFHQMALIEWLDSGALRQITQNLRMPKGPARHAETGHAVYYPNIQTVSAWAAEQNVEEQHGRYTIRLGWQGEDTEY